MKSRPGALTTEFWLSMIAEVLSGMAAHGGSSQTVQLVGLVAGALVAMGYTLSRTAVKRRVSEPRSEPRQPALPLSSR